MPSRAIDIAAASSCEMLRLGMARGWALGASAAASQLYIAIENRTKCILHWRPELDAQ
jgi:hypothetical protein